MECPGPVATTSILTHENYNLDSHKRPMFLRRRRQSRPPRPKKLRRTVTPPDKEEEEEEEHDDSVTCSHNEHNEQPLRRRQPDAPPHLVVSFDGDDDHESFLSSSPTTASSCHDNDDHLSFRVPSSILKHTSIHQYDSNATITRNPTSVRQANNKGVHWSPRLAITLGDALHHHHQQQQQQQQQHNSRSLDKPDTLWQSTSQNDDEDDCCWLTYNDLAQLKANEKSLYRQEWPPSVVSHPHNHHSSTHRCGWGEEDCHPTAKMYLAECKTVYEWMQSELWFPTTATTATTTTTCSVSSKRRIAEAAPADAFSGQHGTHLKHDTQCRMPQQQQQQQQQHHHDCLDWSRDDFLQCVLQNNPILWNGWSFFRGMESGRMPWRKTLTRAAIHTILRLQHVCSSDQELAAAASRLTAVDAVWAHFVAVGDEQQLLMDDCCEAILQQEQEQQKDHHDDSGDSAQTARTSDDDQDHEHNGAVETATLSPTPLLIPVAARQQV